MIHTVPRDYRKMIYENILNKVIKIEIEQIYEHPFYRWATDNINDTNYSLFRGIIINLIPLGKSGEAFFKSIISEKSKFFTNCMFLYRTMEIAFHDGELAERTYNHLYKIGYNGTKLQGISPVEKILSQLEYKKAN
jgi:hypothetical protein